MKNHVKPPQQVNLDASQVGTLPECEPGRSLAHFERLAVMMGWPAPEGGWRYLRDVG